MLLYLYNLHFVFLDLKRAFSPLLQEKWKSPKERGALSIATQKSLDRKRQIKAAEMGITSKQKSNVKQKASCATRILQPSQGQNAPAQRLLHRQG
ncbi:hypothetical protein chiPu_0023582, partial [Chiloscyllium punctatum]|nr:hypothetical protein [Chiloscyllium punctatum]